ncbi:MAG: fructose-bisphosphatase class III [Luteolibacter sp.]
MLNPALHILAERFPTISSAASEIAALRATKKLPKGVIHVISDIHGENQKLRHVINNASGRLRPLVLQIFGSSLSTDELQEFINVLYYPAQVLRMKKPELLSNPAKRYAWVRTTLERQFDVIRALIRTRRRKDVKSLAPKEQREFFEAMLNAPAGGHDPIMIDIQLRELIAMNLDTEMIRSASRFIRNLSVEELIVAGDLGDRGPRIDMVVDYLMHQPNVSLVWGNHDVIWMGACLGQRALIATVLRVSIRYLRMFQIEEGYGILTKALEILADHAYSDDPATFFKPKRTGKRDTEQVARMQKAASILQFKLEGQTIERHPEWEMDDRNILPKIDFAAGTINLNGKTHELRDTHFPTIDPANPNKLSVEEEECVKRLEESFVNSPRLWEQMLWMANFGQMSLVRDRAAIFHACLPVDEKGEYEALLVDGEEYKGPAIFDACTRVIKRAFRAGAAAAADADKDWFYYLWAGPKSPLFGKDRMATFESYFIADKAVHKEIGGPWFEWMHDHDFCDKIARDMGIPEGGMLVNGHVPVRKGEAALKRGGNAVTIDGAFSEAYGDRGYTLILGPEGETLAEHHAFPDPETAVREGLDIIPNMTTLRTYDSPRLVEDTEQGRDIDYVIAILLQLIQAYQLGKLHEAK